MEEDWCLSLNQGICSILWRRNYAGALFPSWQLAPSHRKSNDCTRTFSLPWLSTYCTCISSHTIRLMPHLRLMRTSSLSSILKIVESRAIKLERCGKAHALVVSSHHMNFEETLCLPFNKFTTFWLQKHNLGNLPPTIIVTPTWWVDIFFNKQTPSRLRC